MMKVKAAVLVALTVSLATSCSGGGGGSGLGPSSEFDAETYLPPAPPAFPDQDVQGIDQNANGIRDEVEVLIFDTLGLRDVALETALSVAKELQRALAQDDALVEASLNAALERFVAASPDPLAQLQAVDGLALLHSATYNTLPRALALLRAEQASVARAAVASATITDAEAKSGRQLFNPLAEFDRTSRFNGCVNPVTVVSINGINTTRRESVLNQIKLIKSVDVDLFDSYGIRPRFALIHNPSQDIINDTIQSLFQVLEQQGFDTAAISAGAYELLNLLSEFYLVGALNPSSAESFFVSQVVGRYPVLAFAVELFVASTERVAAAFGDLSLERAEVEARFREILAASNSAPTLLVAHSQGNLFAVDLVNALTLEERKRVGVVHIATPSPALLGPYVTRFDDEIMNLARQVVPEVPPANIASSSECGSVDCDTDSQLGHNLIGDYLGDRSIRERISSLVYEEAAKIKEICFCERDGLGDSFLRGGSMFGEPLFRLEFSVSTPFGNFNISEVLTAPGETYPGLLGVLLVTDGLRIGYDIRNTFLRSDGTSLVIPNRPDSVQIWVENIPSAAGEYRLFRRPFDEPASVRSSTDTRETFVRCLPDQLHVQSSGLLPMCFSEVTGATTYALFARARTVPGAEGAEYFSSTEEMTTQGVTQCRFDVTQGTAYRGCPDPDFISGYLDRNPSKREAFARNTPQCYP